MPPPTAPVTPTRDGEVLVFASDRVSKSTWFDARRRAIFVNGMKNSGPEHRTSALAVSELQMCPVVGVFNQSAGFWQDLGQCIADKWQFSLAARSPSSALDHAIRTAGRDPARATDRVAVMLAVLERNPAARSLFHLLCRPADRDPRTFPAALGGTAFDRDTPIFAHSQGNLITSNALAALAAVYGAPYIHGQIVHSYGSPTISWPGGLRRQGYGFTWDPVSWLGRIDLSFSISKVGWPSGTLNPVTHGFEWYVKEDPTFFVNRFRWGGLGMTLSMDEDGLAEALYAQGTNVARVYRVFRHLRDHHPTDSDDVALLYAGKLRGRGDSAVRDAVRSHRDAEDGLGLRDLLVRLLESGWTSGSEKEAIEYLRAL